MAAVCRGTPEQWRQPSQFAEAKLRAMRIEHMRFCNVVAMAKSTIGHLQQKRRHRLICRLAGYHPA